MEKGKLRIFFGYSAGVGKTYAMLKSAQELKQQGIDVIIGYLEPHDRPDTLRMAEGLESLPLKEISYKGIVLREFDIDEALLRRPTVILVDELAHTNAAGSKNRKRYLDVEELINNGISVYTTVNVQHIEGLHDSIDSVTSVDVNERVPDEVFDYADEVSLVDIEPTDLIDRMREGKIYKKNRAVTAMENFFKPELLSNLREITMRRSADRIEKQSNNGELKTKVLVLISPSPSSMKNIRVASRTAEAYHCKFSAMYVEQSGELSDESAANLKKHLNLVRDLGGEMIVKYGENVIDTVVDYVKLAGVTNLIIGKTWQSLGKKVGLEDKFIELLPNIEILIVPDNQHFGRRKNHLKDILSMLFSSNKLLQKYKTANKTLDIINLIAQSIHEVNEDKRTNELAEVLARAFERSCAIYKDKVTIQAWKDEKIEFFNDQKEIAVAEWCRKNLKAAGKGTDTLRDAKAAYYPIRSNNKICVIALSCTSSKLTVTDKLIFGQLEHLLQIALQ